MGVFLCGSSICGKSVIYSAWFNNSEVVKANKADTTIQVPGRNMRMSKDEYLITDTPLKALTVFAMPMILGSFFQQIYNMADSIIVGQFVGSSALAAVGACAALTNVFICVALGAGVGAGVLVSRYFGAKEYGKMKTIVSTSLLSFLILSIVLGVFGLCFSLPMMRGLQTQPASGGVHCQKACGPQSGIPGSDPGGQHRSDQGCREVRL